MILLHHVHKREGKQIYQAGFPRAFRTLGTMKWSFLERGQWHRRDLNPHAPYGTADFKSAMSAYSITVPHVLSYKGAKGRP